jgi:hypothetical protein
MRSGKNTNRRSQDRRLNASPFSARESGAGLGGTLACKGGAACDNHTQISSLLRFGQKCKPANTFELDEFAATEGGAQETTTVAFTAGTTASAAKSSVTVSPRSVTADGVATTRGVLETLPLQSGNWSGKPGTFAYWRCCSCGRPHELQHATAVSQRVEMVRPPCH